MKAISTGNQFVIYDDSLKTYDQLPAQSYRAAYSKGQGFFLEKYIEPDPRENKIYGDHATKVEKVMKAFSRSKRNLGVILSGDKGIGKTLFAKLLSLKAIDMNLPLIVVDSYIPGIAAYLETIEQECVVLFDEFDKTFGGVQQADGMANPQTEMLALFDGIAPGKKLFVVTCNQLGRLSDYLINRPGRFHYHFRFEYPTGEEVKTYLQDKLPKEQWKEIDDIVEFSSRIPLNFDCLRAIAFELEDGSSFKEACACLNIINWDEVEYNVTCIFNNGAVITCKTGEIDLYSSDKQSCTYSTDELGYFLTTSFSPASVRFDAIKMATIIDGKNVALNNHLRAEKGAEWHAAIDSGINRLEIRRSKAISMHYTV